MSRLHVDSITKSFGNRQLLTDVFVSCEKGEIIGLLGRNGSGKSTLLKIIFGSEGAQHKFVKVGDKRISSMYDSRGLITYMPQDSFLPKHIKLKYIISTFCPARKADALKANPLVGPFLNKRIDALSGGELRVAEILLLLHFEAKYVLLNEPFNGVAPVQKDIIKDLICQHAAEKGFIVTDHDYRNILNIATKTILLHDGGTRVIKDEEELKCLGYLPI